MGGKLPFRIRKFFAIGGNGMTFLAKNCTNTNIRRINRDLKYVFKIRKAQNWSFCHFALDLLKCEACCTGPLKFAFLHTVSDWSHSVAKILHKAPIESGGAM